jgi:glycosyltransferase involved in cell wall biosynthesis
MAAASPAPGPDASVFAVLVLYGQSLAQSATFQSLSPGVRGLATPLPLLVYDNSPTRVGDPGAATYPGWDIHYVHDPTNPGISHAYQEGARMAAARSKRWLLLLDQDTRFPADWLTRYLAAVGRHPEAVLFAPILRSGDRVLSPCVYRFKRGFLLDGVEAGRRSLSGISVLNSGTWIAVKEYRAAGGHDVRIALDFADHEFIERFKRRHESFVVVDAECAHDFFRVTQQSLASHLTRFRFYCRGARYASKGPLDAIVTAAVVGARACLLAHRYGSLAFLRVAATTLLERTRR